MLANGRARSSGLAGSGLVLGIETATERLGLALWRDGRVLGEVELELGRKHCEKILVVLDGLIADLEVEVADLAGIAVLQGPGSFTGLRIGIAFAQGLALAAGCPLVGISTPDALAHGAGMWEGSLVVCLDARRNEVYFCAYSREANGIRRLGVAELAPAARAAEVCRSLPPPVLVVGDAAGQLVRTAGRGIVAAPPEYGLPSAAQVAALGVERLSHSGVVALEHVEPIYFRRSDAEIRRDVLAGRN